MEGYKLGKKRCTNIIANIHVNLKLIICNTQRNQENFISSSLIGILIGAPRLTMGFIAFRNSRVAIKLPVTRFMSSASIEYSHVMIFSVPTLASIILMRLVGFA